MLSLVLVVLAGLVGAALGLFLAGPSVVRELRELGRRLVAGRSATIDPETVTMSTTEDRDLVAVEVLALLEHEAALPDEDRSTE